MVRHTLPASPVEEIERYRADRSARDPALLTPDIVAFLQSGVDICIGARGPNGRPLVGRATGVRVAHDDVRITVSEQTYGDMIEAVAGGSALAVTFSRAIDHRSIQLKAATARILAPEPEDIAAAAHDAAHFRDELVSVGYDPAWSSLFMAYDRLHLAVLAFVPSVAYAQTPGPGAGEELRP